MEMLKEILKKCDEIKTEFNSHREATQKVIRDLEQNVETLKVCVSEQKDMIRVLSSESKLTKLELSENTANHIQQQQLSNTIEISGLLNSPTEEMTETVLKLAAAVNNSLKKQQITSIKHKKNGKTTVTISEREKCNELISASFNTTITNPQQSQTNATKNGKQPVATKRIFISNALTTTNQLIYKQLRDLKARGTIDKISFFNGIFSIHQPGKLYNINIYNREQLENLKRTTYQSLTNT
jgi:hypothetical protein